MNFRTFAVKDSVNYSQLMLLDRFRGCCNYSFFQRFNLVRLKLADASLVTILDSVRHTPLDLATTAKENPQSSLTFFAYAAFAARHP